MPPNIDTQFYYTTAKISATLVGLIFVVITGFNLPNIKMAREELMGYSSLLRLRFPTYTLITSVSILTILILPLLISFNLILYADHLSYPLLLVNLLFVVYILCFAWKAAHVTSTHFIGNRKEIMEQIGKGIYFFIVYMPFIVFLFSLLIISILNREYLTKIEAFLPILLFVIYYTLILYKINKSYFENKENKPDNECDKENNKNANKNEERVKGKIIFVWFWVLILVLLLFCYFVFEYLDLKAITVFLILLGILLITLNYFIFDFESLFFQLEQRPLGIAKTSMLEFNKKLPELIKYCHDNEIKDVMRETCKSLKSLEDSFVLMEKTNLILAGDIRNAKESIEALRELSKNPKCKHLFRRYKIFY